MVRNKFFTNEDATVTEATDQSCSWKFSTGMEVRLWQDDSGFHLAFSNCPDEVKIREMQFPVWHLNSPDLRLLMPKSTGFLTGPIENWAEKAELSCSFSSYQMAACFGTDRNILVMLPDEEHYLKNIKVRRTEDHVEAAVTFFVPQKEKVSTCTIPYPVILEEFTGGWFEAAEHYRRFAWNTKEYRKAKERINPLRNTAMWFWNRGGADEVGGSGHPFCKRIRITCRAGLVLVASQSLRYGLSLLLAAQRRGSSIYRKNCRTEKARNFYTGLYQRDDLGYG